MSKFTELPNRRSRGISKIWLTNKISATLIIPKEIALKHGLDEPSHVVVEETKDGILIRKLDY
jgi:hypothetical protein